MKLVRFILLTIFYLLFLAGCHSQSKQRTVESDQQGTERVMSAHEALTDPLNKRSIIDSLVLRKIAIDTSRTFKNFAQVIAYKKEKDSLFREYVTNNSDISSFDKEIMFYDNSILFAQLMFTYFRNCDKTDPKNFGFIGAILYDYGIFSNAQLLNLFSSFPAKFRNSPEGKKYLGIISLRPNNSHMSINVVNNELVETLKGADVSLASVIDHKQEFYILFFTASWCTPCTYYATYFKDELEKLNGKKVKVISFSVDNSRDKWLQHLRRVPFSWHHFRLLKGTDSPIMKFLKYKGIPRYVLLDRSGKVLMERNGYGMKEIIEQIK